MSVLIAISISLWSLSVVSPQGIPDSLGEQRAVREAVREGRVVPLDTILKDAFQRYPGTLVEVELEKDEYEIKIIGASGVVMELEYDARTGRFLEMETDD